LVQDHRVDDRITPLDASLMSAATTFALSTITPPSVMIVTSAPFTVVAIMLLVVRGHHFARDDGIRSRQVLDRLKNLRLYRWKSQVKKLQCWCEHERALAFSARSSQRLVRLSNKRCECYVNGWCSTMSG
jgi:hypothetical protein